MLTLVGIFVKQKEKHMKKQEKEGLQHRKLIEK